MNNFSDKNCICQLISLLIKYNIRHIVVCPGSRNAPIVHSLAETDKIICHPITDERSAGFVAIGIADATNEAVAICCTSGSAILDIAPAIAEAHYRNIPLLIISADRPKEWIGQMDGQTIIQNNCLSTIAKCYDISDTDSDWYRNRIINEALASLYFEGKQPIHLNIQIAEPLFNFSNKKLPQERIIEWECQNDNTLSDDALNEWNLAKRKMIVIGQLTNIEANKIQNIIARLSTCNDIVIVAEHLSNIQNTNIINHFDDILENADNEKQNILAPDLVVYIGGHIVSKRIKQFLRTHNHICWHVTDNNHVVDLFKSTTRMIKCDIYSVLNQFPLSNDDTYKYSEIWHNEAKNLRQIPTDIYSPINVVKTIINNLPSNNVLALANSSSVRYAQHFDLPQNTIVVCNRGVNGIDGSLSAAVGFAMSTTKLVVAIIGDLSFFYDQNALWNNNLPKNLRIILLNDNCGAIFSTLNGLEQSAHRDKFIAASHNINAAGTAQTFNCEYYSISSNEEMNKYLKYLFTDKERTILAEFKFGA